MRNSFVISKKKIPNFNIESYKYIKLNLFHIYVDQNLGMLKTDSFIFKHIQLINQSDNQFVWLFKLL